MLRTTSISIGRQELRRDRRYQLPPITVTFAQGAFAARNWSLGGVLLESGPAVSPGSKLIGQLAVAGRNDPFEITAEALRRDATGLACRFLAPAPAMIAALDGAVAERFRRARGAGRRALAFAALVAGGLLTAAPALAGGTANVPPDSGVLVPGGAPLPEFRLVFPPSLGGAPSANHDLEISLTSPDQGVLQFLFSPRPEFGLELDRGTGTSRSIAGLSWNLFDNWGFFGNLGFSGSVRQTGIDDFDRKLLGPQFSLHSTVEFGYQLGNQHSLTLSLDHASAPDFANDRYELNNVHLRYGLHF